MINEKDVVVYDIEVFAHDSLIVTKDYEGNVKSWWSVEDEDWNGFQDVLEHLKGKVLCGYNNYFYDDKMLYFMTVRNRQPSELKKLNDALIRGTDPTDYRPELLAMRDKFNSLNIRSIDCFQQIDVSRPSLKYIEGNMGISIEETDIPFDYPDKLTEEQRNLVYKYCLHDVDACWEVFKKRKKDYFDVKDELIDLVRSDFEQKDCMKYWGTNTISANVLLKQRNIDHKRKKVTDYIPEKVWRNPKYEIDGDIWDFWENWQPGTKSQTFSRKKFGCDIVFGTGGLHGVPEIENHRYTNVLLSDVGSMYPTIITNLRAIGTVPGSDWDAVEIYDGMRKERLKIKHTNKNKANALKLVLNSVYGNLKYEHSMLYHPVASTAVCAYGQIALFDLSRRLYKLGYKLMNLNTDGVAFVDPKGLGDLYKDVERVWQEEWNMSLETDSFTEWIQKDVNNYIAVTNEGKIKTKGGDCNKYSEDLFFKNNSIRIVQIGLVEKLLNPEKDVFDIIDEHLKKPYLFQFILRAGRTYKGVCDEDYNFYNQTNRVFAVLPEYADKKLFKCRQDNGLVNFPDTPENMKIINSDVSDLKDFGKMVDKNYYAELIRKKVRMWEIRE